MQPGFSAKKRPFSQQNETEVRKAMVKSDKELKASVNSYLSDQMAAFFNEGIRKLVPQYVKCLKRNSNVNAMSQCM